MSKIDIEELRKRIYYDPETGAMIHTRNGEPAGTIRPDGYIDVQVLDKKYKATHIAFAIMMGKWPEHTIDHKDRDPLNNKWTNLREATSKQQAHNQAVTVRNKLGVRGVDKRGSRYRATINFDKTSRHLGYFSTLEEARLARMKAELEHYGVFSSLVNS